MKKLLLSLLATIITTIVVSCSSDNNIEIIPIQDAVFSFPAQIFTRVADAPSSDYTPEGEAPGSCNVFLLKSDDGQYALFDAGEGQNLLHSLDSLGVKPEQISNIFITHAHWDHIGGLVKDSVALFTNAKIWISAPEFDALREQQSSFLAQYYGNNLHKFGYEETLPYGIIAIAAPGHTPGHTMYQIGEYLIAGDLLHAVSFQTRDPYWCASFDNDPALAAQNRIKYIQYAKDNNLHLALSHSPAPYWL